MRAPDSPKMLRAQSRYRKQALCACHSQVPLLVPVPSSFSFSRFLLSPSARSCSLRLAVLLLPSGSCPCRLALAVRSIAPSTRRGLFATCFVGAGTSLLALTMHVYPLSPRRSFLLFCSRSFCCAPCLPLLPSCSFCFGSCCRSHHPARTKQTADCAATIGWPRNGPPWLAVLPCSYLYLYLERGITQSSADP